MNITDQVRNEIPKVLKDRIEPVQEKDLLALLAERLPDLTGEDGKLRSGVLRGILNKLDSKPVEKLGILREDNKVFYYYAENSISLLTKSIERFIQELEEKELASIDLLTNSEKELTFKLEVSRAVKMLQQAIASYEN